MVYDCFPFFNEVDILKLRLNILNPYVDRFVIEESTVTFSGEPKELVFEKYKDMFREFLPKITYIVVDDTPIEGANTYERDYYQKNNLIKGLKDATEDDIIIMSDADEIPCPETLQNIIDNFDKNKVYHLAQRNFYVYVNNEEKSGTLLSITKEFPDIPENERLWLGTKICNINNIPKEGIVRLRDLVPVTDERSVRVANGGWHFGYMGGYRQTDPMDRIGVKTKAAAHQDFNDREVLAETMDHLILGMDIFGRKAHFERVEIDDSYPVYLRENLGEYKHFIMPKVTGMMKFTHRFDMTVGRFCRKAVHKIMGIIHKFVKSQPWIKETYLAVRQSFAYVFTMSPKDRALVKFRKDGGEALRFKYDIKDTDVVFDLGGYKGDWTAKLPNLNSQIYIFEPVKKFAEDCMERFKGKDNIHCYAFGLDATTHEADISHEADASSQYHNDGDTEVAKFVSIEDFMNEHNIDKVKLIKMNIEGGEYDILEALIRDNRIKSFENLQIQFHDIPEINSKERMEKIWAELEKTHKLTWAYRPYIHENWELKEQ